MGAKSAPSGWYRVNWLTCQNVGGQLPILPTHFLHKYWFYVMNGKIVFRKIASKLQVITKFNVTQSRLHCTLIASTFRTNSCFYVKSLFNENNHPLLICTWFLKNQFGKFLVYRISANSFRHWIVTAHLCTVTKGHST